MLIDPSLGIIGERLHEEHGKGGIKLREAKLHISRLKFHVILDV